MSRAAFPKPVFHGDTIRARSIVRSVRASKSLPEAGVEIEHQAFNQRGEMVRRRVCVSGDLGRGTYDRLGLVVGAWQTWRERRTNLQRLIPSWHQVANISPVIKVDIKNRGLEKVRRCEATPFGPLRKTIILPPWAGSRQIGTR